MTASCIVVGACTLPGAGPTSSKLESPTDGPAFTLVKIDERVVNVLRNTNAINLPKRFRTTGYVATNVLRPGDSVVITVYESGGSSIFSQPGSSSTSPATAGGATTIPQQVVEADGMIKMPFVGSLKAAGRTPGQLGKDIEQALEGKTVQPQVIVSSVSSNGNVATVGGDVAQPRQVTLSLRGERLLDVIAQAGGAKYAPHETYVRIVRSGNVASVSLQTVISTPSENIVVRPNDQIFVVRTPRTFTVFGASQKVSEYVFESERVTLAEGVARTGGPIDQVGNPAGVYLFRYEPIETARQIWETPPPALSVEGMPAAFVPVLYRIDLSEPSGYFMSQRVLLKDKDTILITNAEAAQLIKTLGLVRGVTGIAFDLTRNSN